VEVGQQNPMSGARNGGGKHEKYPVSNESFGRNKPNPIEKRGKC